MKLLGRLWGTITQVLNFASLLPFSDNGIDHMQVPLLGDTDQSALPPKGPRFKAPGHDDDQPFFCEYPTMTGWRSCSTPEDRGCWLKDDKGNTFDIKTNYENIAPAGILREYTLEARDGWFNADGMNFTDAKLFNDKYPGTWIQACWGDTVRVTVKNSMKHNGTSIHWHGIRQNQTMHMDGVNGITQCPIAPGHEFVYEWNATQYGSSWYHSHYSIQYADGLVGPLTLHGPSSAPYDHAADIPLLMTDWGHNSAFEALYTGLKSKTILLNGRGNITKFSGNVAPLTPPEPYSLVFEPKQANRRAKRYLLRLINTSFDTTFVFSIDNHNLTIVSADFVPIYPYSNTSVLIGIGQRYNVIVEANPIANASQPIRSTDFWMRTYVSDCANTAQYPKNYETNGILRYDAASTADPLSLPWNGVSKACSDETYTSLVPVLPWTIGNSANAGQEHDVVFDGTQKAKYGPLAIFGMEPTTFGSSFIPLRINFSDPTFLFLNKTGDWPEQWVITPENYGAKDWVYLVIAGDRKSDYNTGAHPIHLHGHDFALLQQAEAQKVDYGNLKLKFDNPPRRDVVLLPRNGFVVIAFKTDNPGAWLLHCHIATHAARGLAMQILERQKDADEIWPWDTSKAIARARETCQQWDQWHGDCNNWWPGGEKGCARKEEDPVFSFQDDSGI
ncbi:multicopper oxidase-domain-containing protein [Podospora aff. communis PSN243]|uniref:Multicopper oxidase-domain-containing protein n=1 Tax=Podospora aff. communis PSN243 TaxID=3040156 RepID=A0AAV9GGX8_9PEZI|nr:multicopper oxidase-domain-containing protein [Podospora aff. communis PSN243]